MAAKKAGTKPASKPASKPTPAKKSSNQQSKAKTSSAAKAQPKEQNKADEQKAKGTKVNAQTKAILLFALSAVLFSLIVVPGESLWNMCHNFLTGLFGNYALLWPCLLLYVAVITALERKTDGKVAGKLTLAALTIMLFSACIYVFSAQIKPQSGLNGFFAELGNLYHQGVLGNGAGLLSGLLGVPFALMCGLSGAEIICVILLIVVVMFLFGITFLDIFKKTHRQVKVVKENMHAAREKRERHEQERMEHRRQIEEELLEQEKAEKKTNRKLPRTVSVDTSTGEVLNGTGDFNIDVPLDDEDEKKENIDFGKKLKDMMENVNNATMDIDEQQKPVASKVAEIISKKKKTNSKTDPAQKQPDPQTTDVDTTPKDIEEEILTHRKKGNDKIDKSSGYSFPPVELLHPSYNNDNDTKAMEELQTNGEKLVSTLQSFGVKATITNICRGPSVTRFELQPAPGVKISKITSLSDDIALNLAADGVRIEAPIPGKAAVGIEVPNRIVSTVSMRELIDSRKFENSKSKLSVVLGKDISGNIVVADLGKMPHLLIAGTTGSGKSVCVNSILISLLYKSTPEEVKLLLIDPKMVEFSKYKGIPHLLIPVVSDAKKAAGALNWAVSEMLNRYKSFAAYNVRDIRGYNNMVEHFNKIRAGKTPEELEANPLLTEDNLPAPQEKMHSIVIAIDELADLMMAAPNEVEESICRLAQMARAAGMHLIIATQRPSVNVITGVIKANIPSRISLKVSSQIDSRTILDFGGAEKLIGRGDMLFAPVGAPKPLRVQGCYASDEEIENVTGFIKSSHSSEYNEEVAEQIDKIAAEEIGNNDKKGSSSSLDSSGKSEDPIMEEAIKLVVEAGQASTSLLQRRLRLGYARAGRLIDEMEQMGIVGPHEGSKAREVKMTYQQWLERQNLTSE